MIPIRKMSQACQVSVKTLRYYSQIGLLEPAYIDPDSGFRYYEAEQIDALLLILRLKRYGFSLDEIRQPIPRIFWPHSKNGPEPLPDR